MELNEYCLFLIHDSLLLQNILTFRAATTYNTINKRNCFLLPLIRNCIRRIWFFVIFFPSLYIVMISVRIECRRRQNFTSKSNTKRNWNRNPANFFSIVWNVFFIEHTGVFVRFLYCLWKKSKHTRNVCLNAPNSMHEPNTMLAQRNKKT